MAEDLNPVGLAQQMYFLQNPAAGMQMMQQQQLAQQMMQDGSQQADPNQMVGGHVVPMSPFGGLAKMGERIAGAYTQNQNNQKLAQMMQGGMGGAGSAGGGITGNPGNPADIYMSRLNPEGYKAQLALMNAGPIKAAEQGSTYFKTPEGTYVTGNQMGGGAKNIPGQISGAPPSNAPTGNPNMTQPQQNAAITDIYGGGQQTPAPGANSTAMSPQGNGGPVVLNKGAQSAPQMPMAGDGTPLLPNLPNIPPADPHGLPSYGTPNTESGVNLNKQFTEGDMKANQAFASEAQSLAQEKSRIQNLLNVYQQVRAGTLTAQDPAFFQKLAAAGISDNPEQLRNLAGLQTAVQNHILQVIGQIKDTNANLAGGQATRVFGSEIGKLLDEGESVKEQPQALWNIITQAQGQVDHHLDMMNSYQKIGGMGNRLLNGTTMPADVFATQYTLAHPIQNFTTKAQQQTAPFVGMPGNSGAGGGAQKAIVKRQFSPSTNKTRIVYSDGTEAIQ